MNNGKRNFLKEKDMSRVKVFIIQKVIQSRNKVEIIEGNVRSKKCMIFLFIQAGECLVHFLSFVLELPSLLLLPLLLLISLLLLFFTIASNIIIVTTITIIVIIIIIIIDNYEYYLYSE